MEAEKNLNLFNCEVVGCNKKYKTKKTLLEHHRHIHAPKILPCDECEEMFSTIGSLNNHKQKHIRQKQSKITNTYKCPHPGCNKMLKTISSRNVHVKTCHEEKKHICEICGLPFALLILYRGHLKTHENPNLRYECKKCLMLFKSASGLRRHRRTHSDAFKCTICQVAFTDDFSLQWHLKAPNSHASIQCSECKKEFSSRVLHRRHKCSQSDQPLNIEVFKEPQTNPYQKKYTHVPPPVIKTYKQVGDVYVCDICHKSFHSDNFARIHQYAFAPPHAPCT